MVTEAIMTLPIFTERAVGHDDPWAGSPFEWFKTIPSPRGRGVAGERIVAQFLERSGHTISRPGDSDCDIVVGEHRVEVKASTTWAGGLDRFTWQQIRDQRYDRIVFLGVNPQDAILYWATKEDLQTYIFGRNEFRQHAGSQGGQDLYWIRNVGRLGWFREIIDF